MIAFVFVLTAGAWLTASAMLAEPVRWLRPFIFAAGLAIAVLALVGVACLAGGAR